MKLPSCLPINPQGFFWSSNVISNYRYDKKKNSVNCNTVLAYGLGQHLTFSITFCRSSSLTESRQKANRSYL